MRGGCKTPEITPFEPDLDNSSVGKRHIYHLQIHKKPFPHETAFFIGEIPATATFEQRQETNHGKPFQKIGPKPESGKKKQAAYP